ncbi:hypothetical protein RHMOL_Rhmol03G0160400 [Rhododendron molle]|uniref:Uncharacterized protein n=1 Tax=Rhododendron molle TaxID=49168 RepID=A0ACC0PF89_RHOML|nr:hypothetical protein RHMOL_Rhmol03G0160400 [Rhododendron molle]
MADGTISIEEGLGFKAIDSNEIRRKQRGISDPLSPIQLNPMPSGNLNRSSPTELEAHNPKYMKPIELGNPLVPNSNEAIRASSAAFETHKLFDLCPGALNPQVSPTLPSSSSGSGPITTIPSKQSSPSRKLQQAFFEEGLILEAEERARLQHQVVLDYEAKGPLVHGSSSQVHRPPTEVPQAYLVNPISPISIELQTPQNTSTSVDPVPSTSGFGIHSPTSTKNTSPSRKLQLVFMELLFCCFAAPDQLLLCHFEAAGCTSNLHSSVPLLLCRCVSAATVLNLFYSYCSEYVAASCGCLVHTCFWSRLVAHMHIV